MPTKLKSLKLTSVSLVDQGANQRAEINLKKRKDPNAPKEGFLKRLLDFVKKSGYKQEDVETKLDDIEKSRFTDEIKNQEKSEDGYECGGQIDSFIEAIRFAILSDLFDDSLSPNQRGQSITSSINDFADTALKACESWKNGKPADVSVDIEKMTEPITDESVLKAIIKARDGLSSVIDKSTHEVTTKAQEGPEMQKGADDMKIDKSKLTEAERAFLDSIEKRYGSDDQPATVEETKPEGVEKSLVAIPSEDPKNQPKNAYKDLSPEVQKEIEELKKYKEAAEDRELHDVAKRYEIRRQARTHTISSSLDLTPQRSLSRSPGSSTRSGSPGQVQCQARPSRRARQRERSTISQRDTSRRAPVERRIGGIKNLHFISLQFSARRENGR